MLLSEYAMLSHLSLLVILHYLGKHELQKLGLFSHAVGLPKITQIWLAMSSTLINQF